MSDPLIDLRSDTVTKPSDAMRRAMAEAPVGDDVYREDPTIDRLQEMVAGMLGKEAALYVPSGTMSNQLCLRTLTQMGDEVICHEDAHILHYEGGSAAALSALQLRPVAGDHGVLSPGGGGGDHPTQQRALRAHRGGGDGEHAQPLRRHHLAAGGHAGDIRPCAGSGASRSTSTAPGCGTPTWPRACLSPTTRRRRTRCPYASRRDSALPWDRALAGSYEFVERARNNRKRFGGAMRQAGIIAAGAVYALEHNLARLAEDHENAAILADYLLQVPGVVIHHPVQTNIVIADVSRLGGAEKVLEALREEGVLCGAASPTRVRFVTHLDVSAQAVKTAGEICARVLPALASGA